MATKVRSTSCGSETGRVQQPGSELRGGARREPRGHRSLTFLCFQDVLYASDSQPSLYLSNLVQGTYLFQLQVTDAQGRRSSAAATMEVRPGGAEAELRTPELPDCF